MVLSNKKWGSLSYPNTFINSGSRGGTRTPDQVVNSHPLYRLSYPGIF